MIIGLIYRLANMCLLERSLNRSLGNRIYSEKVEVYRISTFIDTKVMADDYSDWTKDKINMRQLMMANKAKGIWKINF